MLKMRVDSPEIKNLIIRSEGSGRIDTVVEITNAYMEQVSDDRSTDQLDFECGEYDEDTEAARAISERLVDSVNLDVFEITGVELNSTGASYLHVDVRESEIEL